MKVESFRYHDRATGWQLEDSAFDQFNLLVGVSGVGKSRILSSLGAVQRFATNNPDTTEEADWAIQFEHGGHRYRWEASVESSSEGEPQGEVIEAAERAVFAAEAIVKDGRKLVERSDTSFDFEGSSLPRLKRSDSAITLLAEEPSIAPLREAFNLLIFSEARAWEAAAWYPRKMLEAALTNHSSIERLRESGRLPALMKSYLLQEVSPEEWGAIKDLFTGIFPSVEDVRIDRSSVSLGWGKASGTDFESLVLCLRERGVEKWIRASAISSGMRRTLNHLVDIFLAPPGAVVIIDEFENSLGKNCMPALTDFIRSRAPDLQYFITSHHPYIINNIPIHTWKLVRRRGSHVTVLSAREIPALQETSHHDAFDRLLNLPEFEEGVE